MEIKTNDEVMGLRKLLNNRIDSQKLQLGDHIYAYRKLHLFSHHGIYVGKKQIIHFMQTKTRAREENPCSRCGYQKNRDLGVVKSCLACFLDEGNCFSGHSLRRYQYNVPESWYKMKRTGSCSTRASKPPEVVDTATRLLINVNDFGDYNLLFNNCESFATYCKTDIRTSAQVKGPFRSLAAGLAISSSRMVLGAGAILYLRMTDGNMIKNHSEEAAATATTAKEAAAGAEKEEEEEDDDDVDDLVVVDDDDDE